MPAIETAAAVVTVGSKLFGIGRRRKARKRRRQATAKLREVEFIKNIQRKRAFMRRFRQAQAQLALLGAREGGLESSRFLAQRATLGTQAGVGLGEFREQVKLTGEANVLLDKAARAEGQAELVSGLAGAFTAITEIPGVGE